MLSSRQIFKNSLLKPIPFINFQQEIIKTKPIMHDAENK